MATDSVERWTGVRLWVYRAPGGKSPCSIILRRSTSGLHRDVLIGRSGFTMEPASRASLEPEYALLAGLVAILGLVRVQEMLDSQSAAQQLRGPRGDYRGNRDH